MPLSKHEEMKVKVYHQKYFPDFKFLIVAPEKEWHLKDDVGVVGLNDAADILSDLYGLYISKYDSEGYLNITCHSLTIYLHEEVNFSIKGPFSRQDISLIISYFYSGECQGDRVIRVSHSYHNFRCIDLGVNTKKTHYKANRISFTGTRLFDSIDYNSNLKNSMINHCLQFDGYTKLQKNQ